MKWRAEGLSDQNTFPFLSLAEPVMFEKVISDRPLGMTCQTVRVDKHSCSCLICDMADDWLIVIQEIISDVAAYKQ